jgi:putative ABC transport system permease protein
MAQFVLEGGVLGCVGGSLGVVGGVALAALLSAIGIPMPPPPGMSHGFTGGISVNTVLLLEAFGLAVVTTLLASVYPARKASHLPIVDALRHNR